MLLRCFQPRCSRHMSEDCHIIRYCPRRFAELVLSVSRSRALNTGVFTRQASALSSPSAAVHGGLPFGVGSPTLPSGLLGGGRMGGSDAYSASPTRAQSHSGAYGVTHQVCAGNWPPDTCSCCLSQVNALIASPDMLHISASVRWPGHVACLLPYTVPSRTAMTHPHAHSWPSCCKSCNLELVKSLLTRVAPFH